MGGCGGMKRTFPICSVATAETRTGRRAVDRARAAVDPRGPVTEAPARRAVCCLNANIFFPQLSFASRELARSGPARVVPREVQTWVRSCGAARWCRARCFVEQRVRSRVGNCQFGGGAFFGQTRPKSRRVVAENHGETPSRTLSTTKSSAVFAPDDAQNCQKISYMVIGDETYQIYGLRS